MRRILVIDDDREWLPITGKLQHAAGYESWLVTAATTLETQLGSEKPDLIVTDVLMPGISGVQVYDTLRQSVTGPRDAYHCL